MIKSWQKVLNPVQPTAEEFPTKRPCYQDYEPQDQEVPGAVTLEEENERPQTTTAMVPEKLEKRDDKGRLKGFDWVAALVPSVEEIANRVSYFGYSTKIDMKIAHG